MTIYLLNITGDVCNCSATITYSLDEALARYAKNAVKNSRLAGTRNHIKSTGKRPNKPSILLTAKPNPFTQSLTVILNASEKTPHAQTRYSLSLININGATVLSKTISNSIPVILDTKSYASGIYLLTVKGSDGTIKSTKVLKINN